MYIFIPRLKNKPIFLHLEWDGVSGFIVLCCLQRHCSLIATGSFKISFKINTGLNPNSDGPKTISVWRKQEDKSFSGVNDSMALRGEGNDHCCGCRGVFFVKRSGPFC